MAAFLEGNSVNDEILENYGGNSDSAIKALLDCF